MKSWIGELSHEKLPCDPVKVQGVNMFGDLFSFLLLLTNSLLGIDALNRIDPSIRSLVRNTSNCLARGSHSLDDGSTVELGVWKHARNLEFNFATKSGDPSNAVLHAVCLEGPNGESAAGIDFQEWPYQVEINHWLPNWVWVDWQWQENRWVDRLRIDGLSSEALYLGELNFRLGAARAHAQFWEDRAHPTVLLSLTNPHSEPLIWKPREDSCMYKTSFAVFRESFLREDRSLGAVCCYAEPAELLEIHPDDCIRTTYQFRPDAIPHWRQSFEGHLDSRHRLPLVLLSRLQAPNTILREWSMTRNCFAAIVPSEDNSGLQEAEAVTFSWSECKGVGIEITE